MYNCHIHTFLEIDVPDGFPNKAIKKFSESKLGYAILKGLLKNINPFNNKDGLDKLLTFIKEGRKYSQHEVLSNCASNYPAETSFVVLTMDMEYMGAGKTKRNFIDQLFELDRLRINSKNVYPFLHLDCRRPSMMVLFNEFIVKRNWTGVKMYPPLGVFPQDTRYRKVYEHLQAHKKPIITHCTYGNPVHFKGKQSELKELLGEKYDKKASRKENCNKFTDPNNWEQVAIEYPNLKFCLAHSGGLEYWLKWFDGDNSMDNPFNKVKRLCSTYENAYMDISYTLSDKRLIPILKLLLRDPILKTKILFGSDYYMSLNECSEKEWSVNLRAQLTEKEWEQIAVINPKKFLNV